jgi:hypothetical protein
MSTQSPLVSIPGTVAPQKKKKPYPEKNRRYARCNVTFSNKMEKGMKQAKTKTAQSKKLIK